MQPDAADFGIARRLSRSVVGAALVGMVVLGATIVAASISNAGAAGLAVPNSNFGFAQGYYEVDSAGGVYSFGNAGFFGSVGGATLAKPIVGMAATSDGQGYWLVGGDGGIFNYGDATLYGSMGGQTLSAPIVGMASTSDGHGYWLVGSDGAVYAFGDAAYLGGMNGHTLNQPIVGITASSNGSGYWLIAKDGGVFTYGAAGCQSLVTLGISVTNIVGAIADQATDGTGGCFWLVGNTGSIYSMSTGTSDFTQFYGSLGANTLNQPVIGGVGTPDGQGYWLTAKDGGIFTFGECSYLGGMAGTPLAGGATIVAITSNRWAG